MDRDDRPGTDRALDAHRPAHGVDPVREAAPVFPFRADWHRFAAFIVLKAPDIPSILFESGYLTNQVDAGIESATDA